MHFQTKMNGLQIYAHTRMHSYMHRELMIAENQMSSMCYYSIIVVVVVVIIVMRSSLSLL